MEGGLNASWLDGDAYLQRLNAEFGLLLLPAVVFLGLLLLLGFLGNILVLYIYTAKMKEDTTKVFIQALASLDLLSVCLGIPGEMVDMLHNFTFGASFLCKPMRCLNMFCILASGMVLCVVAVDRYKRICCPFGSQISLCAAKGLVIACCLAAMLVTTPTAILVGRRTIPIEGAPVNGSDCSTADAFQGTAFPLAFNALQFSLFVLATVELVTLYGMVGWRVWAHRRHLESRRPSVIIRGSSSDAPTDLSPSASPVSVVTSPSFPRVARASSFTSSKTTSGNQRKSVTFKGGNSPWGRSVSQVDSMFRGNSTWERRRSLYRNSARRTTQMLFIITSVFMLSFLPHLALMSAKAVSEDSLSGRGGWQEVLFNIALRSYFINSVANPVIYSLFSHRFRRHAVALFKQLCCCCCCCCRRRRKSNPGRGPQATKEGE